MSLFSTFNGIIGGGVVPISFEFIGFDTAFVDSNQTIKNITLATPLSSLSDAVAFCCGLSPIVGGSISEGWICVLTSTTNVRITRDATNSQASTSGSIGIIQFPPNSIKSKQTISAPQGTRAISSVDTSKSIIFYTGMHANNTSTQATSKFNSSTEIQIQGGENQNVGFIVVETN